MIRNINSKSDEKKKVNYEENKIVKQKDNIKKIQKNKIRMKLEKKRKRE